jgi:O-antigen/teichoic acid export membrane protein
VLREVLRQISWLGAAHAFVKPIWFLYMTVLCSRILDAKDYGVFTTVLSVSLLGGLITDFGTTRFTIREVARARDNASLFYTNFLVFKIALSLVAFGALMICGRLFGYTGSAMWALVFASVYTLGLNFADFSRSFFQAFERLKLDGLSIVLEKILVVSIGAVLLYYSRAVEWTLAGMTIGVVIATVGTMAWLSRHFAHFDRSKLHHDFIIRNVPAAIPLGLTSTFAVIYYRTDVVMIASLLGDVPAGQYGISFRVADSLNLLPVIVSFSVLFPRLSRLWHNQQRKEFARLFKGGLAGLFVVSTLLAIPISLFAEDIVWLLTADLSFQPAGTALRILAWTYPFNCVHSLLSVALIAIDESRSLAWITLASVLLNIGANFLLIPRLGIDGAAITTLLSAVFLVICYGWRCLYKLAHGVDSRT